MDDVLLLISGASGAGKTSVREAIAARLTPTVEAVELRHLDAIPASPDLAWRQRMAERAVVRRERARRSGPPSVLGGDPVAPGEFAGGTVGADDRRYAACRSPRAGGRTCSGRG